MAARKTKHLSDEWRKKIQTSMIINRLESFVKSEVEMSPAQVTAALGLLKKALPDLQAVQISGDEENPVVHEYNLVGEILKTIPSDKLEAVLESVPLNPEDNASRH